MPLFGLNSICNFDSKPYKSSNTLFILGSGISVMDIDQEKWDLISKENSLGFNAWVLHDFVPTYYAIETSKNETIANLRVKQLNKRKEVYKNTPVFIQYQHMLMASFNYDALDFPKNKIYYNAPYMPNTTSRSVLRKMIATWVNNPKPGFCDLFHYSASLSYMIGLGYIMGYKKIVLLGIDLNDSGYFFEHSNANEDSKEFASTYEEQIRVKLEIKQQEEHATVSKKFTSAYGCLPIDVFIEELQPALKEKGVQLFIGNENSRLHPMLPLYTFD